MKSRTAPKTTQRKPVLKKTNKRFQKWFRTFLVFRVKVIETGTMTVIITWEWMVKCGRRMMMNMIEEGAGN